MHNHEASGRIHLDAHDAFAKAGIQEVDLVALQVEAVDEARRVVAHEQDAIVTQRQT